MRYKHAMYRAGVGLLSVYLLAAAVIAVVGLLDHVIDADLAIVPGNTVHPDGTPSARLQGRLDAAVRLFHAGRCRAILVSGGVGVEGWDEAAVMHAYLVQHGVPAERVYTDHQGWNTLATARAAAALTRAQGFQTAIVVSQYFHIARLRLAMYRHGIAPVGHVHARYFELRDGYALAREVFGFTAYVFQRNVI